MTGHMIGALIGAAALLIAGSQTSQAADAVPAELKPPAGYIVAFTARASGVQIYTSVSDAGAAPKWVFEAPLAELTGRRGIMHHYAGPSWESADGSKVARDKDAPVITVPAKQASADIPWLLIKVAAAPEAGVLSKVGFVQRIATHGGATPAKPPVRVDTKIGVPYTATYVFFAKAN